MAEPAPAVTVDDVEASVQSLQNELRDAMVENDRLSVEYDEWVNERNAQYDRLRAERSAVKDSPLLTDEDKAEEYREISKKEQALKQEGQDRVQAINTTRGKIRRLQGTIDGQQRVLQRAHARLEAANRAKGLCYHTHPHGAGGCEREGCGCAWTADHLADKVARAAHNAGSSPPPPPEPAPAAPAPSA